MLVYGSPECFGQECFQSFPGECDFRLFGLTGARKSLLQFLGQHFPRSIDQLERSFDGRFMKFHGWTIGEVVMAQYVGVIKHTMVRVGHFEKFDREWVIHSCPTHVEAWVGECFGKVFPPTATSNNRAANLAKIAVWEYGALPGCQPALISLKPFTHLFGEFGIVVGHVRIHPAEE